MKQQSAEESVRGVSPRIIQSAGLASGYLLLAGAAIFLVNLAIHTIQLQVFDGVIAGMLGVVGIYGLVGAGLIVRFTRPAREGRGNTASANVLSDVGSAGSAQGVQYVHARLSQ